MATSDTEPLKETTVTEPEEKTSSATEPEKKSSSAGCCKTALRVVGLVLLAPVALVASLGALIVWVVLAPLKCICPCFSPCLTLVTEALLAMAKGLCRLFGFGCREGGDVADDEKNAVKPDEKSSDYGSTAEESKK